MNKFSHKVRELSKKATPTPWSFEGEGGIHMDGKLDGYRLISANSDNVIKMGYGNQSFANEGELIIFLCNRAEAIAKAGDALNRLRSDCRNRLSEYGVLEASIVEQICDDALKGLEGDL